MGLKNNKLNFNLWDEPNYMYQLSSDTDPEQLREKIVSDFNQIIFPFYKSIKTFELLIEFLVNENCKNRNNFFSLTIAILLVKAGNKERSKVFFKQSPGELADIKQVSQNFGLCLDD